MVSAMKSLLNEIRRTPVLWMLIFVPAVLVGGGDAAPHSHTLLFVLLGTRHRAAGRPAQPR